MTSRTPRTPYLFDVSVLIEIARGDADLIRLVQRWDSEGQPMVMPVLALTAASLDASSAEADDLLGGLELFDRVEIAPIAGADQALALAGVMAKTGLDVHDAQVAAIADVGVLPILTFDPAKWETASHQFDEPLHIRQIDDSPDE
ncbi:PIN domain-containing protein [Nonomuraea sp. LPB2021202275-12-8]|uniref:PIN domain-containing protein n=1 Tax=Nonomuraea sp. LPB2021202275-12-8 TaxID=3120159 RepID=UPI00300D88D3